MSFPHQNDRLPMEEVKRQSPETTINYNDNNQSHHSTSTSTHLGINSCRNEPTTTAPMIIKRRRRRVPLLVSQFKLIIVLLSLLQIGDNRFLPIWMPSKGQLPLFGTIFVSGAATNDKVEENKRRMTRVTAAPDVPLLHKTKKDSTSFLKSFNFLASSKEEEAEEEPQQQVTFSEILKKAGKSGIGGGIPGAIAGVVQVLSLMWLRTIINYQCRYGSTFSQAIRALLNQGGIPRFYRGLSFALIQAPLTRFVATASNDSVETLLANLKYTKDWGPGRSTVIASIVVGIWRIFLMPIDTCKTVLQVDSVDGFRSLMRKVKAGKIYVLYQGAAANAVSAIFSHYPWFYTFRVLSNNSLIRNLIGSNILRNALIGFISSIVSDTFSNSIRVVKTAKQAIAAKHSVGYGEVIAMILAVDGFKGLFGRGLRTRILGNALQSVLFTVIWRGLAERNNGAQNETRQSSVVDTPNEKLEESDVPLEEERF
jgi:hypothetical protein